MTGKTAGRGRWREHPHAKASGRSRRMPAWRLLIMTALGATVVGACGAATAGTPAPASHAATIAPAPPSSQGTPTAATSPSPSDAQLQVIATNQIDTDAERLLPGFGMVWAASTDGLLKVSASGTPDALVPGPVTDIAVGSRAVYALTSGDTNELVEVDPSSGKTLRHWTLAPGAKSLVVAGDAAYVDHGTHPATIDRIDLKTGRIKPIVVGAATDGLAGGQALAAGAGLVWATDGMTVYGLDPTDLAVRRTVQLSSRVDDIWFGDGSVWVAAEQYRQGVHRIDPATGVETAHVAADAVQIAFSPHGVWLSASDGPIEIDPTTAAVAATLPASDASWNDAFGIAVVGDEVWVAYKGEGELQRIKLP